MMHLRISVFLFWMGCICPMSGRCQQITGGDFEYLASHIFVQNSSPRYKNPQFGLFSFNFIRLVNFPFDTYPYPTTFPIPPQYDTIEQFSKGLWSLFFTDSTNPKVYAPSSGKFGGFNGYAGRSCLQYLPYKQNKVYAVFVHYDARSAGPQYTRWYSSLKLNLNYSTPLTVGQSYLISLNHIATDSVDFVRSNRTVDSLFIGSALNSSSVGDTIAIVHPQLCTWNKSWVSFIPTKPYSHFTIGNCSDENGMYSANIVDNCRLFAIQHTAVQRRFICEGDSIAIGDSTSSITEWKTGDTLPSKFVSTPGWYVRYKYPSDSTVFIDSFQVQYTKAVSSHSDTTVCQSTNLLINSSRTHPASTYVWSTGQTNPFITTLDSGWVHCTTTTQSGCIVSDSFLIHRAPNIVFNLSTDTILCYGQNKTLTVVPQTGIRYLWNTLDTLPFITVSTPGIYTLTASNMYCKDSATRQVLAKGLVNVALPTDTVFCFDDFKKLLLDAGNQYVRYLWKPTGETTSSIYATQAQRYTVWVKDSSNCDGSGSTLVNETCPDFLFVPNAFTPNGDGLNDVFLPQTRSLQSYEMTIVNRWGQTIFTTKETTQGWDGSNAPADVYVVHITYQPKGKAAQSKSQNVTLLR